MPSDPRVRQAMAELAKNLPAPFDVTRTLAALTRSACDTIAGADHASITVVHNDGRIETVGPTANVVAEADLIQAELREGPCFDAATEDESFVSEDLGHDPRWPRYGPRAAELGLHAQMGVALHAPLPGRAALNVYADDTWSFEGGYDSAELFASHASLLLGFGNTVDHYTSALESRRGIGVAIGIVMERYQIDEDRAFGFLVRVSQDSNVKLRDVAADIVTEASTKARPLSANER
jgi:ANTAR domain